MTTGIYKISIGDLHYIGQSKNIERRWKNHRRDLNRNKHCNDQLQRTSNNSNQAPVFKIIKRCFPWDLNYWERELGDRYSNCDQKLPQKRDRSPITGIAATIAALVIGWVASPLLFRSASPVSQGKPVTVLRLANVRATPNGKKLRTVENGAVLKVIDRGDGWYNIVGGGVISKTMIAE